MHAHTKVPEDVAWRRGFYDKIKTWEAKPPKPGKVSELTRKYEAQHMLKGTMGLETIEPLAMKAQKQAQVLARAAAKKRRQRALLRDEELAHLAKQNAIASNDSDSATTSSSSSDAASSEEGSGSSPQSGSDSES